MTGAHALRSCNDPYCPNRGMLAADTNYIFYIVEGTIRMVRSQNPGMAQLDDQADLIAQELDTNLSIIEGCCAVDGRLRTSDRILFEEMLAIEPRRNGLLELSRFSANQQQRIFRVVRNHLRDAPVYERDTVRELRMLVDNRDLRPDDIDATLILVACELARENGNSVLLSSDPDLTDALTELDKIEDAQIGGLVLPTERITRREYFPFITRLHDCCSLSSERYDPLADAYNALLTTRVARLERPEVRRREEQRLQSVFRLHTVSVRLKAQERQ